MPSLTRVTEGRSHRSRKMQPSKCSTRNRSSPRTRTTRKSHGSRTEKVLRKIGILQEERDFRPDRYTVVCCSQFADSRSWSDEEYRCLCTSSTSRRPPTRSTERLCLRCWLELMGVYCSPQAPTIFHAFLRIPQEARSLATKVRVVQLC